MTHSFTPRVVVPTRSRGRESSSRLVVVFASDHGRSNAC
jgi:hypothetical protein